MQNEYRAAIQFHFLLNRVKKIYRNQLRKIVTVWGFLPELMVTYGFSKVQTYAELVEYDKIHRKTNISRFRGQVKSHSGPYAQISRILETDVTSAKIEIGRHLATGGQKNKEKKFVEYIGQKPRREKIKNHFGRRKKIGC